MKVLFLIPNYIKNSKRMMLGGLPLGILYISSYLKLKEKDAKIKILDCITQKISLEESLKIVKEYNPGIVGVNITTHLFMDTLTYLKNIKKMLPKSKIVCGGSFANSMPQEVLKFNFVDYVLIGETEPTFYRLYRSIKEKRPLSSVPGLVYKYKGKIKINKSLELIKNLDELPFPDRDLINHQLYFPEGNLPTTSLLASRGCSFSCIFCSHKHAFGQQIRRRSTDNVIAEIKECKEKYGIKYFEFLDSTFISSKVYVKELCEKIINNDLNIVWQCQTRIETLYPTENKSDIYNLLTLMKKSGCEIISFGIESGDQNILNLNKKPLDLKQVNPVLEMVNSVGIETQTAFIFGLYGETKETLQNTIDFIKKIKSDKVNLNRAWAYPGTELYNILVKEGRLENPTYWRNPENGFSIIKYDGFDSLDLERVFRKELMRQRFSFKNISRRLLSILKNPSHANLRSFYAGIKRFIVKFFYPEY